MCDLTTLFVNSSPPHHIHPLSHARTTRTTRTSTTQHHHPAPPPPPQASKPKAIPPHHSPIPMKKRYVFPPFSNLFVWGGKIIYIYISVPRTFTHPSLSTSQPCNPTSHTTRKFEYLTYHLQNSTNFQPHGCYLRYHRGSHSEGY